MRHIKSIVGLMIFFLSIIAAHVCMAEEAIEIVKVEGNLTASDAAGANQKTVKTKDKLPPSNILATGADGRAVVRVGNTGYIVLEKNSKVEINTTTERAGFFRHITGMIYYGVNSIKGKDKSLEVRTKTATMGIRGTRFLVTDIQDRNEVGMRKGVLSVLSLGEEFEIHKKAEQEEFEAMKRAGEAAIADEKSQFEKYKDNAEHEVIEYKREFTLAKDRMVSFDGQRVDDRPLSGESKKDMETLENYGEKWLSEVND